MYRSSTGNLDRYDDPPAPPRGGGGGSVAGGGERWDRARFESMRRGGPPPPPSLGGGGGGGDSGGSSRGGRDGGGRDDYDHFRFREHDKGPGYHRDVDIHEDRARRGPPVMERERFREVDDRFSQPARRSNTLFEEPTPSEVANQALAPYRRKSVIDQDINIDISSRHGALQPARPARPPRPQYIRRQSSLDTFDRRPLPRYGDVEKIERNEYHEYRLPPNVPIPLPIRAQRRRSPPRRFREEDDFEEIRYDERGPRGRGRDEEAYREVEIHREKSRVRRSKSVAQSTRSSSTSSFEEIQPSRATFGKKGKTRMPKRLVKKQAVIELGYPFEEEDDFIVITRALEKEHIDEVIKISESYKEEKTTYVYEEKFDSPPESVAPPPPPSVMHIPPPPPASVYAPPPPAVVYAPPPPASVYAPPPPAVVYAPPPPASVYAPSVRAPSPHQHYEEYVKIEQSNHMHGPGQLVRRDERHDYRSERDIKDEIRMLEDERRMLKYEREADYEIIERRDPKREVIRVDKDRKGRRDRPNPKLVAAMMSTLT